jgi:hypothetical protein
VYGGVYVDCGVCAGGVWWCRLRRRRSWKRKFVCNRLRFFFITLACIMYMLLTNAYMYLTPNPLPPHNNFNPNICKAEISNLKKSEGIAMLCLRSLLHSSSTSREVSPDACVRAAVRACMYLCVCVLCWFVLQGHL